jgi:predicted RNase H-like HicB family nuclease
MNWFKNFSGKSDSSFVKSEVLRNLPRSIIVQFSSEFDENDNPIIFICSPEHDGLISEARTHEEAITNAQDAILTYFDIPKTCATLIEFDVKSIDQQSTTEDVGSSIRVKEFCIRELSHAYA